MNSGASDLQNTTLTVGAMILIAGIIWSIFKARDWLDAKIAAQATSYIDPIKIELTATKINIENVSRDINAFKVQAAREFVTNDAVLRLEHRMDTGFDGIRHEIGTIRTDLIKAVTAAVKQPEG